MNDLDPLLHEAMANVKGPVDLHPSIRDVHRRARRHHRRRMVATVGAVACTGVATAALIIRRDSTSSATDSSDLVVASTTYPPFVGGSTTVPVPSQTTIDAFFVWDALANIHSDPSAAGLAYPTDDVNADQMPTAEMFGCTTQGCGAMFNYVVWHEIARLLGFFGVPEMQEMNPGVDFGRLPRAGDVLQSVYSSYAGGLPATTTASTIVLPGVNETPTTIGIFDGVILIDGGAPAGAMEDAYQRLAGYNRTIAPGTGKTVAHTEVMPIDSNTAMAVPVGQLFGVDRFDPWDPTMVATPMQAMVAVVIGPDYFDLVQNVSTAVSTTTSIAP
jgi:hypothetical protein